MGAKVLEGEDRDVATGSMAQMAEKRLSLPPDSQDGLRNLSPESAAIGRHILRLRHGTGGPAQQTTTQTYVQKEYTAAPT
jgi:hypothetical protein